MNESTIEKKVVAHCKMRGIRCYKFSSPAHRGVPDRILLGWGRVLFLELKSSGKTPSALQQRDADKMHAAGFTAAWCDSYQGAVEIIDAFFCDPDAGEDS